MSLSRRKTLALIGGGVILAAGAAGGVRISRSPQTARLPWEAAGGYSDPRMRALSHAILAPNPHNRQPWIVDLGTPDEAVLYVDTDRLLPHTDPFNRQITIGLGCFLEVLRIAALEDGLAVSFDLFPDGADASALDGRPVAVCRFAPTSDARDPLFAQVQHRRSLKEPFDTGRPVPDDALAPLIAAANNGSAVSASTAPETVAEMRELSRDALRIEIETPNTYKESVDLFRIGAREVDANPDGISFTGPLFEGLAATGQFTREIALDTSSAAYKQGIAAVYANTDTAMGHLWQVTKGNTREDQINAGRDWVRINLTATGLGLSLQPLSQALQEYPEMKAHFDDIHARLAPNGGTVQMWARLGYGPDVPPSPRWPLEAKLKDA